MKRWDTEEHIQKVFLCMLLQGNLQQADIWVTVRDKGSLLFPTYMDEMMGKVVAYIFVSKNLDWTSLNVEALHP